MEMENEMPNVSIIIVLLFKPRLYLYASRFLAVDFASVASVNA